MDCSYFLAFSWYLSLLAGSVAASLSVMACTTYFQFSVEFHTCGSYSFSPFSPKSGQSSRSSLGIASATATCLSPCDLSWSIMWASMWRPDQKTKSELEIFSVSWVVGW